VLFSTILTHCQRGPPRPGRRHDRGYKAVVRVMHMKRDVFGDGLEISEAFRKEKGWDAKLVRANGTQDVRLKYKLGSFPHEDKQAGTTSYFPVMLVSSFFDGKEIFLYVVRKSFVRTCSRSACWPTCSRRGTCERRRRRTNS